MKIAILSDIHDNYHNLVLALDDLKKRDVTGLIFLGDFMNGGIAAAMASTRLPLKAVWGNNDGDRQVILRIANKYPDFTVAPLTYAQISYGGRKLFISHYPDLAMIAADSGRFDGVFFGHTHKQSIETKDNCLLINPGELSAHKTGTASYAVYDTDTNTGEIIFLENIVTVLTPEVQELYRTRDESDFK